MPLRHPLPSLRLVLALICAPACATTTTYLADRCDVSAAEFVPAEGAPGTAVKVAAGPLTRSWDTTVLVGGVSAVITDLEREGCDSCDLCRAQSDCNACDDCDDCDALCALECAEAITFVVPELPAGVHAVQLINGHGSSAGLHFTVLPGGSSPADTGAPDSGAPDSGGADTSAADSAAPPVAG
jgi:hypothetical protein